MRERNYPVQIYLSEKEYVTLCRHAEKSGFSKSGYIRFLLNGYIPKEVPKPDFFTLYRELNAIGNSLNQIAARANAIGFINARDYNAAAKEVQDMTLKIYDAVTQPERIE